MYVVTGNSFSQKAEMDHLGAVTDVKYSPDGNYLAASDGHRKVIMYSASTYEVSLILRKMISLLNIFCLFFMVWVTL